jgi:hypothetical protein
MEAGFYSDEWELSGIYSRPSGRLFFVWLLVYDTTYVLYTLMGCHVIKIAPDDQFVGGFLTAVDSYCRCTKLRYSVGDMPVTFLNTRLK